MTAKLASPLVSMMCGAPDGPRVGRVMLARQYTLLEPAYNERSAKPRPATMHPDMRMLEESEVRRKPEGFATSWFSFVGSPWKERPLTLASTHLAQR